MSEPLDEVDADDPSDDESDVPDEERRVDRESAFPDEVDADDRCDDEFFELDSPVSANATLGVAANAMPIPSATERALNWPT
ncbi:MAG: hypothetical protein K0U78_08890 [Actinomycetia bacterium]|nr:hypothetical protein [Actinomycetes bacterium]